MPLLARLAAFPIIVALWIAFAILAAAMTCEAIWRAARGKR